MRKCLPSLCLTLPLQITIRVNGTLTKNREEIKMELPEGIKMGDLLKSACKRLGAKDNYKIAKLYNKNGIQLFQDDLMMLNDGDILYIALRGKKASS